MTPTLGVSIIVKNGIDTFRTLLDQLECLSFTEIVVVDTGSTDGTWEYLQRQTKHIPNLKLFQFEWDGRFDSARNFAKSHCATDWMLWLDADDTLENFEEVEVLIDRADAPDAYHVPYVYSSDELGSPVLVQKRERLIRNPQNWTWKNSVHEVLEYVGDDEPKFETTEAFIVKHNPVRAEGYGDRNWNILAKEWIRDSNTGPFMTFYLMREATTRGEYLLANRLAGALIYDIFEQPALPFHKYEAWLTKARVYRHFELSSTEIGIAYMNAIKAVPELNEARCEYILWLVDQGKFALAQEIVNQLHVEPPATVGVVDTTLYGSHVFALSAFVDLRSGQNVAIVLSNLLRALDFPVVSPLCHKVDAWVRKTLRFERVGLIYVDRKVDEHYSFAKKLAERLTAEDVFAETYIFTNPLIANYANDVYFHVGNQDSLYHEETDPYTTQVLISSECVPSDYLFGWDFSFVITDDLDECVETVYQRTFSQMAGIPALTLAEGLEIAKSAHETFVMIAHPAVALTEEQSEPLYEMLANHPNDLIAINEPVDGFVGKREKMLAYKESTFIDYDRVFVAPVEVETGFYNEQFYTVPKKSIYIYAEGVEPWDGLTPYSRGIGASEASVVYLAEELAKEHRVFVFSPTQRVQIISGVTYVPNFEFGDYPEPDVLISSRCPHILTQRLAPVQLLWLHDLYQDTVFPDKCVFDRLICVSEQERQKAMKDWGHKAVTIPNPYKPNDTPSNPVHGRAVWLSSPDRGVVNVLESPVEDLWLTYSYFNARVMRAKDPIQFRRIWQEKYRLRQHGVKLTGRLGLFELRRLLATCDIWPYASRFEETFCVSALEAIGAGLQPFYTCHGATMETVQRYTAGGKTTHFMDLYGPEDVCDAMEDYFTYGYDGKRNRAISPDVFPENVCEQWKRVVQ